MTVQKEMSAGPGIYSEVQAGNNSDEHEFLLHMYRCRGYIEIG